MPLGVTKRITLGTLVTGMTYRHPGLLIKTVTTLDVLSGGRAWLGIGAAWNEEEHRGLGVPYPGTSERFERLEETLRSPTRCGPTTTAPSRASTTSSSGRSTTRRPSPSPTRGSSLAAVARRRRCGWSRSTPTPATSSTWARRRCRPSTTSSGGHCEDVGRDYDDIEKTVLTRLDFANESDDQMVERFGRLGEIGTDHVILGNAAAAGFEKPGYLDRVPGLLRQLNASG